MLEFDLIQDIDGKALNTILSPSMDAAIEDSLTTLGFRVEPKGSDDNVRSFYLIDNNSNQEVFTFKHYFYESACIEALSVLGYSIYATETV